MVQIILELVLNKKLTLFVSPPLKTELTKKPTEFNVPQQLQDEIMLFIDTRATLLDPTVKIEKSRDRDDNFLLELAETAQAEFLITRDKDVLVLEQWKNTKIVMPEAFLPLLRELKNPPPEGVDLV